MSSKKKTSSTKSESTSAFVPKLRFPEFRGQKGWERRTLGSIAIFHSGGTPAKDNPDYWNGDIPWVSASSMYDHVVERADHYVTSRAIGNGTRIARKGSILILVRGSMLFKRVPICIASVDVAFNQDVKALRIDPRFQSEFIAYQLISLQSRFIINETGIGAGKIELDHLENFEIYVPQLSEQLHVSACLASLDNLISSQARKVELLKKYKKGLLQQLFPREGETEPRLRFPEFRGTGAWERKKLGEVCSSFSGGTPSTHKTDYYGGDIPFIRSAEIARTRTELSLTREGLANSAAKMVSKGQILVALYGANSGDVALAKINGAINQAILCLNSNESNAFIYHFLSFKKEWIIKKYLQGGQGNLSGEIVKSIVLTFPSIQEQECIATSVSSLDSKVAAETQKLEALKTQKKGLMQGLFPNVEDH